MVFEIGILVFCGSNSKSYITVFWKLNAYCKSLGGGEDSSINPSSLIVGCWGSASLHPAVSFMMWPVKLLANCATISCLLTSATDWELSRCTFNTYTWCVMAFVVADSSLYWWWWWWILVSIVSTLIAYLDHWLDYPRNHNTFGHCLLPQSRPLMLRHCLETTSNGGWNWIRQIENSHTHLVWLDTLRW